MPSIHDHDSVTAPSELFKHHNCLQLCPTLPLTPLYLLLFLSGYNAYPRDVSCIQKPLFYPQIWCSFSLSCLTGWHHLPLFSQAKNLKFIINFFHLSICHVHISLHWLSHLYPTITLTMVNITSVHQYPILSFLSGHIRDNTSHLTYS